MTTHFLSALVVLGSLVSSLYAATPHEASFRVRCRDGFAGSATAISEKVVVTNAHVVSHRHQDGITLTGSDGSRYTAKTVGISSGRDLALLAIHQEASLPYVLVAEPSPGDSISMYGFGSSARLCTAKGRVTSIGQERHGNNTATLLTTVPARNGDSGGGVFNEAGQLVAVIWGSDFGESSHCTPAHYLNELVTVHQTQCQGDSCWSGYSYSGSSRSQSSGSGQMRPSNPNGGSLGINKPGSSPIQAPVPQQPSGSNQPTQGQQCDLTGITAELKSLRLELSSMKIELAQQAAEFKTLAGQPGPAGPAGPKGDPGPKGDSGSQGLLSPAEKEKLVSEISMAIRQRITGSIIVQVAPK